MGTLFENHQLVIRPILGLCAEDLLEAIVESKSAVAAWETWALGEYNLARAERYLADCYQAWREESGYTFALFDALAGRLIGSSTLRVAHREHNTANLGYWVHTDFTGRGIATGAAAAVATYGLSEKGFARIEIVAQVGNVASRRVAEKVGATFEGILRNRLSYGGEPRDAAMYSLTPADLRRGVLPLR